MLLHGTYDGVYRTDGPRFDSAEQVLDSGRVLRIRQFDGWEGVYAATKTGLYRSIDDGATWTDLGVPREEVYSVVGDSRGERLYTGTHPAHLYVSEDGGGERTDGEREQGEREPRQTESAGGSRTSSDQRSDGKTWRELEGFQDLPSREEWYTPRHRNEAHIRSLGVHADAPDRVVAGVEVGGVHVSDDRGETWTERKAGVHDDVHHVLILGADEYVASCGGGLYRTRDAGETWTRLDEGLDHTYFREAFFHDGVLYAAAARSSPGTWSGANGADAALFESRDGGDTFDALDYPGRPEEVVLAWTTHDGEVVAGTNDGRVIIRERDGWIEGGEVPAGESSLCGV